MPGLLDQVDPYAGGYSFMEDPFEAAARRQRQAAKPIGGRQEGWLTENPDFGMVVPRSPADVALLAAGGPLGRAAKVAALAGAGVLSSDEAQAGPAGAVKKAGTLASDLWHGISQIKLPKPISEMSAVIKPVPAAADEVVISPAKLQGGALVPLRGDRTAAGGNLLQVNGFKFDDPVALQGGHGFMANNVADDAAWASAKGVASRLANTVKSAAESERPIYGVYTAMGERSADFSHHVSDALSEMMKHVEVSKKAAKDFDRAMKTPTKDFGAAENWPGILSIDLRDYLQQAPGKIRSKFAKTMDKSQFLEQGFPSVAEARFAVTDPRLLNEATGASGLSIAQLDPSGKTFKSQSQHISYDTNLAGKYVGGMPTSVPQEIMYPEIVTALEKYRSNLPGYKPTIDYLMERIPKGLPTVQHADQQWLDRIGKYLSEKGYHFGLLGPIAAGVGSAQQEPAYQ